MGDRAYKQRHRDLGLCLYCPRLVYRGRSACLKHLRINAIRDARYHRENTVKVSIKNRRFRALYKATGRCRECSALLDPDADDGNVTCSNCLGGTVTKRLVHGYTIV